ncbi:hypothetical protein [Streptomyces sp. LARHCF252]
MSKIRIAVATAGLAVIGAMVPIGSAQAAAFCDTVYNANKDDGNVRAYADNNCSNYMGKTTGDDSDWGNSAGGFQGSDSERASSVMNTGTYSGGVNIVKFYALKDYRGGHSCLSRGEKYVDALSRNDFSTGTSVNDRIRSHEWVSGGCSKFMS